VNVQHHAPAALPPGKTRYPFYRDWVGPRPGLDGCGQFPSTGIKSPDRPIIIIIIVIIIMYRNISCVLSKEGNSID